MNNKKSIIIRREFTDRLNNEPLDIEFITLVIEAIFDPGTIQNILKNELRNKRDTFRSLEALIVALRNFFATNINKMLTRVEFGGLDGEVLQQLKNLAVFEYEYKEDLRRYDRASKPNPNAIFWPDPDHKLYPQSITETLPFIEPISLLTKSTSVGSAGSCFASEIALYFQKHGYNYVVKESSYDDGEVPRSSARWGIIFNTPSLKQLAEKAFGLRKMPNLVEFNDANGCWQDPFRENIIFSSVESLERNRAHHIEACRDVFLNTKIFIITLGLNECWEYLPDGAVASRFPKSRLHAALFRHKTLTVSENLHNLQTFLNILRSHNPDIQIVVSVSPIPCLATGRASDTHVITANEHSKATLRVVAEEFVNNNSGIHYFPGYELVTRCIKNPWDQDQRHVSSSTIAKVMQLFEKMFVSDDPT